MHNIAVIFRDSPPKCLHFVDAAYPPDKASKIILKTRVFYACFPKFYQSLNQRKKDRPELFRAIRFMLFRH